MQAIPRTSRWRILIATGLVVLLALVVGLRLLVASGPELVAGALSRMLGRTVQIERLDVSVGLQLELEIEGLRIFADQRATPGDVPVFEAQRARVRQSWPRLLAGQLVLLDWRLIEPVLQIPSGAPPSKTPERELDLSFPFVRLEIVNGTVEWTRPDGEALYGRAIQVSAWRTGLRGKLDGHASAVLMHGDRLIGEAAAHLGGSANEPELKALVRDLDLPSLPLGGLALEDGQAQGMLTLRFEDGGLKGSAALDVHALRVRIPRFRAPLEPEEVRLELSGRWKNGVLHLRPEGVRVDDLSLSGDLIVWQGRVRGALALAPFELGRPDQRLQFLRLLGLRHATWDRIDQRTEAGWVEDFEFRFDLPLDEVDDVLAFRRPLLPEELSGRAQIRDAVYRPRPESPPLEDISATLHLHGNVLAIEGLHMTRGGKPLPEINLSVDGLHRFVRLPPEERKTPPGPGVPTPGLGPGLAALQFGDEGEPPRFRLVDFYIGYPAFVLPFRNVNGWLTPTEGGGIRISDAQGVLGGAPALVNAHWDRSRNVMDVDIQYQDGEAPPAAPQDGAWLDGSFQVETLHLGPWRLDRTHGRLRAVGARAELSDVRAVFSQGQLVAKGSASFAHERYAPYAFDFEVSEADASEFATYLGLERGRLTGRLFVNGTAQARLEPGRRFLETGTCEIDLRGEDGTVHDLPLTLAIARVPSVQGLRSLFGQPLPYDTIQSRLHVEAGQLRVDDFLLEGPELRIMLAGNMDLQSASQDVDMVMALLFLQTVDRMIEQLPVLRDLILGKDRSLVAIYFKLDGPRADIQARLLAPDAIRTATDWTTTVIATGVAQLRKIFGLRSPGEDSHEDSDADQAQ